MGNLLTSVTIEEGVTTIENYTFAGCYSLTSITIPDSVISIGDFAFSLCECLKSITIPDSVTSIGGGAFEYCYSLTTVTIGDSVTTIGRDAFRECSSLTSVTIGDSVTTIGRDAFSRCIALTLVDIPGGVTTIMDDAFFECKFLTSVTIPDSVTSIGARAFMSCTSLTSMTIPDSVTTIGSWAFIYCDSLPAIVVSENNPQYSSLEGVLFNKDLTKLIQYPGSKSGIYTIPDSVTTIYKYAFERCNFLTSITIGDNVTTIVDGAFIDCISLTSVTIPANVTTIGNDAFLGCTSITNIYYGGTEEDKANINLGTNNDSLLNATWHYAEEDIIVPVTFGGNSVSEEVSGLAFKFDVAASGMSADRTHAAVYDNAALDGYKLLSMGAVVANAVESVDIPAVYLFDWSEDSVTYAVRLINIPLDQYDTTITAIPYFVLEMDGVATTIYGETQTASMNGVMNA